MSLLDTASLIVTPNGYKEGKLYSVIPSDGSGDMSVVRATTATRVNSAGLVEIVPYNLLTYSEQLDNADWTKFGISVTANATTAPNGTLTADKIISSSSLVNHLIHNTPKVFSQGDYCFSVYVKAAGFNKVAMRESWSVGFYASFDLTNGTIIDSSSSQTNTITAVGNGWYRITSTRNFVGDIVLGLIPLEDSYTGGNPLTPYVGDNVKGIFAWGAQIVEGSTAKDYLRTETRLNIPRLDYSNGSCPSLLVEPQRTNSCLYSEDISNAVWTKDGLSLTANAIASPSGVQNADLVNETTANSQHRIYQNAVSTISGQPITFSAYAKYSGRQYIYLRVDDSSGNKIAFFDVQNGLVSTLSSGVTASIEDAGNGWYRCIMSVPSVTGSATAEGLIGLANSTTFPSIYAGNTSIGVYLWGIQIETNSTYPTSYIPTTSASVTRNADVISKTGISSLIGQTEGTMYFELQRNNTDNDTRLQISDGTTSNWLFVSIETGLNVRAYCISGGAFQFSQYSVSPVSNGTHKIAMAYKNNDIKVYVDGVALITITSGTIPACSVLDVGSVTPNGSVASPSIIKAVALWQTRLDNATLASLTTL